MTHYFTSYMRPLKRVRQYRMVKCAYISYPENEKGYIHQFYKIRFSWQTQKFQLSPLLLRLFVCPESGFFFSSDMWASRAFPFLCVVFFSKSWGVGPLSTSVFYMHSNMSDFKVKSSKNTVKLTHEGSYYFRLFAFQQPNNP